MERLNGWRSLGVHIVTDSDGRVALMDQHLMLLVGPVSMSDRVGVASLCDWLCGYILDTN